MRGELPRQIRHWPGLKAGTMVLALDYDGTLVPIYPTPDEARPDQELLNLLGNLARQAVVVILTGRDRQDIDPWIPDPLITIVTSHGAEWRNRGLWRPLLLCRAWRSHLEPLADTLKRVFGRTEGVLIEDKKAAVAFHYRLVDPAGRSALLARFKGIVDPWILKHREFEILQGKAVKEVRHKGLTKGAALLEVLKALDLRGSPVLAMGDDRTDEDMFRCLRDEDMSVLVGTGKTRARMRLKDVGEARAVLRGILESRKN
ncbi:MAG: trehalose-phosphatase [Deltaproteobacteria bacterium]|nr:trehalose-phosphatase [Deltaproteobacteria bacterium]